MTSTATLTESLTYAQLVAKIQANELKKGASYTITDFQTVHYIQDGFALVEPKEIHTGLLEPLTVMAIGTDKLAKEAKSSIYIEDTIYYDWNPSNWLMDLCFSGETGEIIAGWKGVIFFRHDTKNKNSLGYDFRNVKFRRWALSATPLGFTTSYAGYTSTLPDIVSVNDYEDYLTFNCTESLYNKEVQNNNFSLFKDNTEYTAANQTILANNVFHLSDEYGWYQVFNNSFFGSLVNNTFGGAMYENISYGYFGENIIGDNFYNNSISPTFSGNIIGDSFGGNILGYYFADNVIKSSFLYNNIGNYFRTNSIGDHFENNTTYANVYNLTTPDCTFELPFRNNYFLSHGVPFSGVNFSNIADFKNTTTCEIVITSDGQIKVRTVNSDGELVISDIT